MSIGSGFLSGEHIMWRRKKLSQNQLLLPWSPTQMCSLPGLWSKSESVPWKEVPAHVSLWGQQEEEKVRKDPFKYYLSDVFLLLFFEGKFNEDLLQLLITVVDDELLKAVVLSDKTHLLLPLCKHPGTQLEEVTAAAASQQAAFLTTPSSFVMWWVIFYK